MPGPQQELFSGRGAPDGTVAVNARCLVRTQDGHRVVLVAGIVLCQYSIADRMAETHAMVSLVEQGWADQREVAVAFGYASRTVRRLQRRCESGGLVALARTAGCVFRPSRSAIPADADHLFRQGDHPGRDAAG